MNKPIIPIPDAPESVKEALVKIGILERTEDGYRCKEKKSCVATDQS